MTPRRLLLVRHGEVHARWRGVCYGAADVGLSSRGHAESRAVASRLEDEPITEVISSGLRRAQILAEEIARRHQLEPRICPQLAERSFGAWEKRAWDEIYAETGNAMDGLLNDPGGFSPPGGETTFELRDRVLGWYSGLEPAGYFVAVTHGGPIAALRAAALDLPVADWPSLVPRYGEIVELEPVAEDMGWETPREDTAKKAIARRQTAGRGTGP